MSKSDKVSIFTKLGYIFTAKDKRKIAILLIAVIIGSFLELLGVTIFMPFINIISNPDTIRKTWYLKFVFDLFHFTNVRSFMIALSSCIIVIYLVKNAYLIVEKHCIYKFSYSTQMRLSTRLLATYMKEPYTFHLNKNIATLQRTIQEDTGRFMQVILYFMELAIELVVCVTLGIYLLFVSKSITLIVVGLLAVFVGTFLLATRKYSVQLGRTNQAYQGKIYQWMNQALGGIKEIKILERDEFFIEEYQNYYTKFAKGLRVARTISILPKYLVEAVAITGLLVAIIVKMVLGEADLIYYIPQLTVFAVAAFRLMPCVGRINEYATNMLYALPSVELIYRDLVEIEDYVEQQNQEQVENWTLKKAIEVKDLTYSYPDAEEPVIDGANLRIEKGKTVAFIGTTGAGKTTMVDIILGLLTPQKGCVYADDINIHEKPKTFHKQVGYIPQVIYLSDDTIRNNIAFGIHKEEIDEAAIKAAMDKAQLTAFVESLPNGLDTIVGDRGVRLSGGQRQRIGIARALYHDPEILVLDEATSALDNDTEAAVMEAIDHLQGIKTMIIIAHRLTTIRNVDTIYEVGKGKVTEKSKQEVF